MSDNVKQNIRSSEAWKRALYMLLFMFIYCIAEVVVTAVVFLQLIIVLVSGGTNSQLLRLGRDVSVFIYQILRFLTYNSEDKPYPFGDWPGAAPGE
jgi:hypothetical protein